MTVDEEWKQFDLRAEKYIRTHSKKTDELIINKNSIDVPFEEVAKSLLFAKMQLHSNIKGKRQPLGTQVDNPNELAAMINSEPILLFHIDFVYKLYQAILYHDEFFFNALVKGLYDASKPGKSGKRPGQTGNFYLRKFVIDMIDKEVVDVKKANSWAELHSVFRLLLKDEKPFLLYRAKKGHKLRGEVGGKWLTEYARDKSKFSSHAKRWWADFKKKRDQIINPSLLLK